MEKKKWRNCFEIAILESPIALQKVLRATRSPKGNPGHRSQELRGCNMQFFISKRFDLRVCPGV